MTNNKDEQKFQNFLGRKIEEYRKAKERGEVNTVNNKKIFY